MLILHKYVTDSTLLACLGVVQKDIMNAAQILICKELGREKSYRSVLNWQKKGKTLYPVENEHIQLMHDGVNHWLLSFFSGSRVQVCDSLRSRLSRITKQSLKSLYESAVGKNGKFQVTFLPVEKQTDRDNCGVYAIAFAAEILAGLSPINRFPF